MCHNGPVISRQESKNQYASFALSVLQDNQKKGTKSHVYHNQESKNIYKLDKLQKKKKNIVRHIIIVLAIFID